MGFKLGFAIGYCARNLGSGMGGTALGLAAITSCSGGTSLLVENGGGGGSHGGAKDEPQPALGGKSAAATPALGGKSGATSTGAAGALTLGGETGLGGETSLGGETGPGGETGLGGEDSGPDCADPICTSGDCSLAPTTLAERGDCGEIHMVLRENALFWTEKTGDNVLGLSLTTGTLVQIARDQDAATQIAGDASGLYWLVEGDGRPLRSKVVMCQLPNPGTPIATLQVLASSPDGQVFRGLAVADGKVYYSHGKEIWAVPTTGGAEVLVGQATSTVTALAASGTVLAWITSGGDLEIDDIHEGGTPRNMTHGNLLPGTVALDRSYVYWADGGSLERAAHDGARHGWLASGSAAISSFIRDGKNAYFANEAGDLYKQPLAAAAQATAAPPARYLARDQATASSVAVTKTRVYWATADCRIRSTPICSNL